MDEASQYGLFHNGRLVFDHAQRSECYVRAFDLNLTRKKGKAYILDIGVKVRELTDDDKRTLKDGNSAIQDGSEGDQYVATHVRTEEGRSP